MPFTKETLFVIPAFVGTNAKEDIKQSNGVIYVSHFTKKKSGAKNLKGGGWIWGGGLGGIL